MLLSKKGRRRADIDVGIVALAWGIGIVLHYFAALVAPGETRRETLHRAVRAALPHLAAAGVMLVVRFAVLGGVAAYKGRRA